MKIIKKMILVLIIFILFSFIFTGCNINNKKPIQIGFVGTLQGPTADLALNGKRGAEIAVEEINENGGINGKPVELVIKDSVNDIEVSKDILNNFVEDGIGLVIGDFVSSLTEGIIDDLNRNNILYISPTVGSEQFVGLDDNLIRLNSTSINQANAILMQTKENTDKDFIVFKDSNNQAFSYSINDNFKEMIKSEGGSVIAEIPYDGSVTIDPDVILYAMNEYADIDGVVLASDAVNAAIIVKTINSAGFEVNIYTSRWSNTPDFYNLAGDYADGVYTLAVIDQESDSEKYNDFADKFYEYYGTQPVFSAVSSYEAVMLLCEAIDETNSTQPSKIKDYIIETRQFDGLQNDFIIDEYGDCDRDYILCVIKNGVAVKMD